MKKHILTFLKRGLMASIGGPVILAVIYYILGRAGVIDVLTPNEVSLGIISVSFMAFIASGAGVVYEIDRLPIFTAAFIHGIVLYLDYILIYIMNGWIKTQWISILIFTVSFVIGYAVVWFVICISTKKTAENINKKLNK